MNSERRNRLQHELQQRFSTNLRLFRLEKSLTQEKLAELSGLDSRHIQKLENGEVNATLKTLAMLADALGIEPSQLLHVL